MPSSCSFKIGWLVFLQVRAVPGYGCLRLRCARAAKQKWDTKEDVQVEKRCKWHEIQILGAFLSVEAFAGVFPLHRYCFICNASVSLYYGDLVQIKMNPLSVEWESADTRYFLCW